MYALIRRLLEHAAEGWAVESEYDGRAECYCSYCGYVQDRKHPEKELHAKDCLHLKAINFLDKLQEEQGGLDNE